METGQGYEEGREEETDVRPEGVIDNPPGQREESLLITRAEVLGVLDQWAVGLEDDQTAVHVLQEVELALQDGVGSVGEIKA